jgi:hypothetical protein
MEVLCIVTLLDLIKPLSLDGQYGEEDWWSWNDVKSWTGSLANNFQSFLLLWDNISTFEKMLQFFQASLLKWDTILWEIVVISLDEGINNIFVSHIY